MIDDGEKDKKKGRKNDKDKKKGRKKEKRQKERQQKKKNQTKDYYILKDMHRQIPDSASRGDSAICLPALSSQQKLSKLGPHLPLAYL